MPLLMLMLGTPPMVMVLDTTDMVDMVDMVIVLDIEDTDMADIEDTMERGLLMLNLQLNLQLMLLLILGMPLMAMVLDMPTVDMDMADMVDMDILLTDHMVDTTTASNSRWGNNNSRSLCDDSPVTFTSFNRVFFWSIFSVS